ncbi:MAG: hypothetical protein K2H11_01190, partial [Malacoplasma sp.]|nr:hypothetical protein [Malacoplasma sp.]
MEKDITLLNKFSELKLPWWLLVVPIFNNVTYLIIFKSWFAEFSDRKFIFNYYFWEKIKTFGVLIVSLIVFSILICIFITIDFKFDSYNSDY